MRRKEKPGSVPSTQFTIFWSSFGSFSIEILCPINYNSCNTVWFTKKTILLLTKEEDSWSSPFNIPPGSSLQGQRPGRWGRKELPTTQVLVALDCHAQGLPRSELLILFSSSLSTPTPFSHDWSFIESRVHKTGAPRSPWASPTHLWVPPPGRGVLPTWLCPPPSHSHKSPSPFLLPWPSSQTFCAHLTWLQT